MPAKTATTPFTAYLVTRTLRYHAYTSLVLRAAYVDCFLTYLRDAPRRIQRRTVYFLRPRTCLDATSHSCRYFLDARHERRSLFWAIPAGAGFRRAVVWTVCAAFCYYRTGAGDGWATFATVTFILVPGAIA